MDHKGKNYIITGASRGIGAGIANYLADQGAVLAITYSSNEAKANEVVSQLSGEGHFAVQLNISDSESVQSAFKTILEKMPQVDGLVNNAGITADQLLLRMKEEDFGKVVTTNLTGTFLCTKAVLKPMIKKRSGSIVNITSVVGQMGAAGQSNYAASKAGIEAFTKSVALEVASRGVRLNCVAPGFIKTDMTDELNEKQQQAIMERIPAGNYGEAEDVAQAVGFLLGPQSRYITGQTIAVNGGLYT